MIKLLKEEWKRNPITMVIAVICLLSWICTISIIWRRAGTPEHTEVYNRYFENKSQWQAMMVLPGKELPFEIEHFSYQLPFEGSEAYIAGVMLNELKAQCIFWISTPTKSEKIQIISCFKEKHNKDDYKKSTGPKE